MARFLFCCSLLGCALVGFLSVPQTQQEVALIGVGTIPGDHPDLSGLRGHLRDGTPHNQLGGLGSGIAYTGHGDRYVLVSDRGPKDGATDYACRFHHLDIRVRPGTAAAVELKLTGTTLLTDEKGRPYVGAANRIGPRNPEASLRLDPEGVRVARDGAVFVADEYGPCLFEFNLKGKRRRSLPVPAHFRPVKPGKAPSDELPPRNTAGRQPNKGLEGLAITPDGSKLYAILQGPLLQDAALGQDGKPAGVNCRILEIDLTSDKTREFVYPLDGPDLGVNEILAVDGDEFLVLERDGKSGKEARFKKIFRVNLAGAADVSGTALDAAGGKTAPSAVTKSLFLDLLDPRFKVAGPKCPAKFEGLAFGPDLPDGRRLLLVTVDNDFVASAPLQVYAFAIIRDHLPRFQPQRFSAR